MTSSWADGSAFERVARQLDEAFRVSLPDFSYLARALPDHSEQFKRLSEVALPDHSDVFARLGDGFKFPDFTSVLDPLIASLPKFPIATGLPEYGGVFQHLGDGFKLPDFASVFKPVLASSLESSTSIGLGIYQAAAMTVLVDSVPREVADDSHWREAANEWVRTHSVALFLWLAYSVLTVMYFVTKSAAPDLVEKIDSATTSAPAWVLGIGLAVHYGRKSPNGNR